MGLIRTIKEILIDIKEIFEEIAFSIGIEDKNYIMGKRPFMLEPAGLTAEKIASKIIEKIYS